MGFLKQNQIEKRLKNRRKEIEEQKKRAQKNHEIVKKEAEKFDIISSSKIIKSNLESHSIIEYAKDHQIDLIVMSKSKVGTHAEKMYYNSTVDAVFKNAPCPFLYIP